MHHLIRLHGRIDASLYDRFAKSFDSLSDGATAYLHFNSAGGELEYARKITHLILQRQSGLSIVGIGYGQVHSSALHIFVACTYRVGYAHTKYLLHLPKSDGSDAGDRGIIIAQEEEVKYFAKMIERPESAIRQLMQVETLLDARQAYALGVTNFALNKDSKFV